MRLSRFSSFFSDQDDDDIIERAYPFGLLPGHPSLTSDVYEKKKTDWLSHITNDEQTAGLYTNLICKKREREKRAVAFFFLFSWDCFVSQEGCWNVVLLTRNDDWCLISIRPERSFSALCSENLPPGTFSFGHPSWTRSFFSFFFDYTRWAERADCSFKQ